MKSAFKTIAHRNRVIDHIIDAFQTRDNFLLIGHKNADEDCIASMVAMGLLISKFQKKVSLCLRQDIHPHFHYLLNICRFNSIEILQKGPWTKRIDPTLVICDTPKEEHLDICLDNDCLHNGKLLKIEIDHHLGADSQYIGDKGYCLVDQAISTTELIGILALKLNKRKNLLKKFNVEDLLTRNFVLAVLTGLVGDSKMGRYLKTRREKWFYKLFSKQFEEMLSSKTYKSSHNFSTMEELFQAMEKLSAAEEKCYEKMIAYRNTESQYVYSLVINQESMEDLLKEFSLDTIVLIAKNVADELAELSGFFSLVAYFDIKTSELVQFRMRRSKSYHRFDLRKLLDVFHIENGGGHPGAIGFRIKKKDLADISDFTGKIIQYIEDNTN